MSAMGMLRQFTSDSHTRFGQSRVHPLGLQPGKGGTENEDMDGMARSDLFRQLTFPLDARLSYPGDAAPEMSAV